MTATLRVMLDQLAAPTDADLRMASRELARALVDTAPRGCAVEAVVPATPEPAAIENDVPGIGRITKAPLARRELAAALQLGTPVRIGGGMIHSPSLFAPLVRHDRVHNGDQTVVTLWDLRPWDAPDELPKAAVLWHRAMLKRAVRYADAVVVPTHGMGRRLGELAPRLGDRARVIAGSGPEGYAIPRDEIARRRDLGLPEGFVLFTGGVAPSAGLADGFAGFAASGLDLPVVVIDAADGEEPAIVDLASAAGIRESHVHVRGALDDHDRAAVFGAAVALVAPARRPAFPWRVVEALVLGVPVIAADSDVHAEVIVDGGALAADRDAFAAALSDGLGSTAAADRLAVLAGDRGRSFSWRDAASRVWELHAEL